MLGPECDGLGFDGLGFDGLEFGGLEFGGAEKDGVVAGTTSSKRRGRKPKKKVGIQLRTSLATPPNHLGPALQLDASRR